MKKSNQLKYRSNNVDLCIGYNINRLALKIVLAQGKVHNLDTATTREFVIMEMGFLMFIMEIRFYI